MLGGEGNDIIMASGASSVLTGGAGRDRFNVAGAAAGENGAGLLTITDFVTGVDQLDFGGPVARNATLGQAVVNGGFDAAQAAATELLGITGVDYAFVTNGTDGYLFNGGTTSAIRLEGLGSLNSFGAADILGSNQSSEAAPRINLA